MVLSLQRNYVDEAYTMCPFLPKEFSHFSLLSSLITALWLYLKGINFFLVTFTKE